MTKFKNALCLIAAVSVSTGALALNGNAVEAVPGEFIVKLKAGAVSTMSVGGKNLSNSGLTVKESLGNGGLLIMRVNNAKRGQLSAMSVEQVSANVVREVSQLPEVEYIEPNYIYHATETTPVAGQFAKQWALKNTGQNDSNGNQGKPDADISATRAWDITTGSKSVVVAIVDTGIDYTHPDLAANAWVKPGTANVHGFNAVTGAEDPMDDNDDSHGSHCSGIIGAVGSNPNGISGVNWHVSLMGAKFLSSDGGGSTADAIKAIDYAITNGARVINASWGGGSDSQALRDEIQKANEAGITFVAAAGNNSSDNETVPSFPAGYDYPNVIAVASSNNRDELSYFSNYGAKTVLLAAPGEDIYSTLRNGTWGYLDGTSMAAPQVTGAVALLLSKEPGLTPAQIKERLGRTVDKLPAFAGKTASGGRLNLYKMLVNASN